MAINLNGTGSITGLSSISAPAISGVPAGTESAPAFSFTGDSNTGIYSPGADQVAISTNSTGRLFVGSDGRIGVATSSPGSAFQVNGAGGIRINEDGVGTKLVQLRSDYASQGPAINVFTNDPLLFLTNNTERMRLDASGRLGIGTTSAGGILHTLTTGSDNVNFFERASGAKFGIYNSSVNSYIGTFSNHDLRLATNDTERARIDTSGRFLVGTSTARTNLYNSNASAQVQVEGIGFQNAAISSIATGSVNSYDSGSLILGKGRGGAIGANTIVQNNDIIGYISFQGNDGTEFVEGGSIKTEVDGTPGANDMPGRLVFSTTADGASSPTERMRISSDGTVRAGTTTNDSFFATRGHIFRDTTATLGQQMFTVDIGSGVPTFSVFYNANTGAPNAANATVKIGLMGVTSRSINAAGTINASGADYAEYMTKNGQFTINKGDICGVAGTGLLTNKFAEAVSFVVKSTNPSYVGGDVWGSAFTNDPEGLEQARQAVDRIAFAGQVPINVIGATAGQYIVPIEAADGGIEGIAKNEVDLTLAEYMRAVGKVIAVEDDGRARIIVKVA